MADSLVTKEKLESLMSSLGLEERRAKEDFSIFFSSALERYREMRPSYVARNMAFLMDSLFITMSHATDPKRNPHGTGLSLGSLTGVLAKCSDSSVGAALFGNEQSFDFLGKCLEIARKMPGFKLDFFKSYAEKADSSKLEAHALERFNSLLELLK